MRGSLAKIVAAAGLLGLGVAARAQSAEFRVVERTGQTVVTQGGDVVLDFAVQAKVTGGPGNGMALAGFGFAIVIMGEPDSYGTLQRGTICNPDGTYTSGYGVSAAVGLGGLAAQYTYLATIDASFNGVINLGAGSFTNTPGNQEIGLVVGSSLRSVLLSTPGVDPDSEGNPATWVGYGTGSSPANGATAALDPAIGAEYFAQGGFIDVYRFRYTVSNFTGRHITVTLAGPTVQVFTSFLFSNNAWGMNSVSLLDEFVTITPTVIRVGVPGACCNAAGGDCVAALQTECPSGMFTDGGVCSPNPCPQPLGQCCSTMGGGCTTTTLAACPSGTGEFVWSLTCCNIASGACAVVTGQAGCDAGNAWNAAATCSPNPCPQPPTGACCNTATGACTIVAQADCGSGSTWAGGGAGACSPNPCPQPPPPEGACCDASVSGCTVTVQADCAMGFAWHEGRACTGGACPPPSGTCCNFSTGACTSTPQSECSTNTSDWTLGGSCSPNPCLQPPIGRCCESTIGACYLLQHRFCAATWTTDTSCTPNPCTQPIGTCCNSNADCSVSARAACTSGGGVWASGGPCAPTTCWQSTYGRCCTVSYGGCFVGMVMDCPGGAWTPSTTCGTLNSCLYPTPLVCCTPSSACVLVTSLANCSESGYSWSYNSACTSSLCTQVGRCCTNSYYGTCTVSPQGGCPNNSWSAGSSCTPNPCPQPTTGSCCTASGGCSVTTNVQCLGSTVWTDGGVCSPNPCVPLSTGSCCYGSGGCAVTLHANCYSGYVWTVDATCFPNPCPAGPSGRCCTTTTGQCEFVPRLSCDGSVHVWVAGGACDPNPCPQPITGACCSALTGNCSVSLRTGCTASGLTWTSDGVCDPNPCPQPGRCCSGFNGSCFVQLQSACPTNGTWIAGTSCTPNPCPAADGHCCNIVNAVCYVSRQTACGGTNYAWSAGAACAPNPCLVLGRCCNFVNGVCWMLPRASCGAGAHTWAIGGACDPNPCPAAAACCDIRAGVCLRRTQSACAAIGGVWIVGATCTPTPCPEPDLGKCCNIITGNCTLIRQSLCGINAHTWAPAETCSPNPCEQPGACCRPNGTCRRTLAVNCVLWQGTWSTGVCVPNPCSTFFAAAAARVCRGDFDGSGTLDSADITTFGNAWLAKDPSADFDGSGGLDTEDIFAFLAAWFAGCES